MTEYVWPADEVRNLGVFVLGYKGSGKSRFLGRWLAKQSLWRGISQIVLDPVGQTIDNCLDCVLRLPSEQRKVVLSRLCYFDCSGQGGRVCPLPLYYRFGPESWADVANRHVSAILALDPDLESASILGSNAIKRVGMATGMALAAAGLQISEARLLLDQPKLYKPVLKQLQAETDDWGLGDACEFFLTEYMEWSHSKRMQEAGSFRGKFYALLRSNPTIATFGADQPGVDFEQMIQQGQTILLDFRHLQQNLELLRFYMLWWFDYFLNFVAHRGAGLGNKPIALCIDEISILASQSKEWENRINSLYNIWARQGMAWPVMATQESWQLLRNSEVMYKSLMGSGTILVGNTSDLESGERLARDLQPARVANLVKRHEPIYNSQGEVIAYRQVDLSQPDKLLLDAQVLFMQQPKLHFLVKQVGDPQLRPLRLYEELDPGIYPDDKRVAELRELLNRKCGIPIKKILAEIEQRQQQVLGSDSGEYNQPKQQHPKLMQPIAQSDTLISDDEHSDLPDPHTGGTDTDWRDDLAG